MTENLEDTQAAAIILGSQKLLKALTSGHGPKGFIWTSRKNNGAWVASEEPKEYRTVAMYRVDLCQRKLEHADSLRVFREPCFVCGTRADIGCSHRRVA